jgi:Tol biopolymer transport system component
MHTGKHTKRKWRSGWTPSLVLYGMLAAALYPGTLNAGLTPRVSLSSTGGEANRDSSLSPALSADGRVVAFASSASTLVPGDTNGVADIFVHDRETGMTERVSLSSTGRQGNSGSMVSGGAGTSAYALSADGRAVVFWSRASNLVPGDTNGSADIFVHRRESLGDFGASVTLDFGHFSRNKIQGKMAAR